MLKDLLFRGLENAGMGYGKIVANPALRIAKEFARQSDTKTTNLEVFQQFKGQPVLIVANHTRPEDIKIEHLSLFPDIIYLTQAVESTGRHVDIIAKADNGWVANSPVRRRFQQLGRPFARGLYKGSGQLIPVNRDPGILNRKLLEDARESVNKGKSLVILPTGELSKDWDPNQRIQSGAAKLAVANHLPIIPAYVHGADRWDRHHSVRIIFGEPISPSGKTEKQITEAIRDGITSAQQIFRKTKSS